MSGASISASRTSILETLPKIISSPPKIKAKSTTSSIERVLFRTKRLAYQHPYIASIILVGLITGLSIWGRTMLGRGRGASAIITGSSPRRGFFKLDGKDGLLGGVGLGSGQNGKVD